MSTWQSGVCGVLALTAIASDIYSRRVPNSALVAALLAGAVALLILGDAAQPRPLQALLGLVVGLAAFLPFYVFKWMGAGDVKLMSAIGFLLGFSSLLPIWAFSCLTLTVHSLANLVLRRFKPSLHQLALTTRTHDLFNRLETRMDRARQGRRGMPYAAHIGICTLAWIATGGFHAF